MVDFRVVTPATAILGESPVWDARAQRLYWLDVCAGAIFSARADGGELRIVRLAGAEWLTSLAVRESGGLIVTCSLGSRSGIHLVDAELQEVQTLLDLNPDDGLIFGDSTVDHQGRFVTGTANTRLWDRHDAEGRAALEPPGGLYRVDRDLSVTQIEEGIGLVNGPCFSPDSTAMYCADSWVGSIFAWDYDAYAGNVSNRRTFSEVTVEPAPTAVTPHPDGATVDEEGYVWSAVVFGGELQRFAPDGSLDRRIPVPCVNITSLAFGGPDMDILFLTSQSGLSQPYMPFALPPDGPLGGSILAVHDLGVRGVPQMPFGG